MKQYWALLWINLAGIPERSGLVLTIVIGVAIGAMVEFFLPGHNLSELMLAMLLGSGWLLWRTTRFN